MLVTEIIQHAVAGDLQFDFIESTVTIRHGSALSSQKGRAHSYSGDDTFLYHFSPRGMLREDWASAGGYLDRDAYPEDAVSFKISGMERSSANWTAYATQMYLTRGSEGPVIHGRVKEWTRVDQRSTRNSFLRAVVPGRVLYPATVRHAPGHHSRSAMVHFDAVQLEFRDYGGYTEVSAVNAADMGDDFLTQAVAALGHMLDRQLDWVYMERHRDQRRFVTVRRTTGTGETMPEQAAAATASYHEFWNSYAEDLRGRLP